MGITIEHNPLATQHQMITPGILASIPSIPGMPLLKDKPGGDTVIFAWNLALLARISNHLESDQSLNRQ